MADQTNPPSGGTIDLRNPQGASASGKQGAAAGTTAAKTGTASAGSATPQGLFEKFEIPETVRQQYPDLIPLILETESMNDDERQYWFQILPIMTDEQVGKLREILSNEKQQLAKIDDDYQKEVKRINTKHVAEWKAFQSKEKREKLKAAETATEQTEKEKEEELLKNLGNV